MRDLESLGVNFGPTYAQNLISKQGKKVCKSYCRPMLACVYLLFFPRGAINAEAEQSDHQQEEEKKLQCSLVNCLRWSAVKTKNRLLADTKGVELLFQLGPSLACPWIHNSSSKQSIYYLIWESLIWPLAPVFSHSSQPIATNGASYESPQSQDCTYTLFCTFGYLQLSIYLLTYMGVFDLAFVSCVLPQLPADCNKWGLL